MEEIEGYWALNTRKGTVIKHKVIGSLKSGEAIPIRKRDVPIAKHLNGVVILEKVRIPEDRINWITEPAGCEYLEEVK